MFACAQDAGCGRSSKSIATGTRIGSVAETSSFPAATTDSWVYTPGAGSGYQQTSTSRVSGRSIQYFTPAITA